jgi:hypothetical protein
MIDAPAVKAWYELVDWVHGTSGLPRDRVAHILKDLPITKRIIGTKAAELLL